MNNNKQSSVEWLCERLALKLGVPMAISFYIDHAEEIAEAKAMHKEEVLNFDALLDKHQDDSMDNNTIYLTREEFYNKTFGGKQ